MINSAQKKKCFKTFLCQVKQNKNILPYPLRGICQSQKKCDSQLMTIGNCWNITTDCHCVAMPRSAVVQSSRNRFAWHRPNGNPVTQFQIPKSIKLMCFKPKIYFHSYRSGQGTEGHNSAFTRLERSRDKLSIDSQLQLIFPCRNVYTPNLGVLKCFLKDFLRKIKWFCKNFSF